MSALDDLAAYAAAQGTTGLLLNVGGRDLFEANFPLGEGADLFAAIFAKGRAADGALREDVASQQKSLIAILAAQAAERGLLDISQPVAELIGAGWWKASSDTEQAITVRHLLEMTSGLTDDLVVEARPGERFHYNTPAYARMQRVVEAAGGMPLDALTRAWLTGPLGMADTEWQARPAGLAEQSGNAWGLVTTPRDLIRLGAMVLAGGRAPDGAELISELGLAALFTGTSTNPAYGRLWWVNDGDWTVDAQGQRREGRFIPAAPADAVFALGAQGRILGLVPSRSLVVARLGRQPPDAAFAQTFWRLVMEAL